jgi:hypothetical protein
MTLTEKEILDAAQAILNRHQPQVSPEKLLGDAVTRLTEDVKGMRCDKAFPVRPDISVLMERNGGAPAITIKYANDQDDTRRLINALIDHLLVIHGATPSKKNLTDWVYDELVRVLGSVNSTMHELLTLFGFVHDGSGRYVMNLRER